jgi:hypothetical protein
MDEERVISRHWPAAVGQVCPRFPADTIGAGPAVGETLRRTILELGSLRASTRLGREASAKVSEAIKALWEAAEEQRER